MIVQRIEFHRQYVDSSDVEGDVQHFFTGSSIRATVSLGPPFGSHSISIDVNDLDQLTYQEAHELVCCEMRDRIMALAVKEQVI